MSVVRYRLVQVEMCVSSESRRGPLSWTENQVHFTFPFQSVSLVNLHILHKFKTLDVSQLCFFPVIFMPPYYGLGFCINFISFFH